MSVLLSWLWFLAIENKLFKYFISIHVCPWMKLQLESYKGKIYHWTENDNFSTTNLGNKHDGVCRIWQRQAHGMFKLMTTRDTQTGTFILIESETDIYSGHPTEFFLDYLTFCRLVKMLCNFLRWLGTRAQGLLH